MAKKKRRNPPSRKKYDQDNPVVSFRVKRKDKDRFTAIREKLGMSHGDVYNAGLGVIEVKVGAEDEIRQKAYDEGEESGINRAAAVYMVTYPCSKCGKMMEVGSEEEKKAIRKFIVENGWHHGDCNNP